MNDKRIFFIVSGVWAFVYLMSIVVLQTTEPTGDGFTRGLNRLTSFLSWQLFAGFVAIGVWVLGSRLPKGSQARLFSRVPVLLALVMSLVVMGVVLFASYGGRNPEAAAKDFPVTQTKPVAIGKSYRGYFRSGFEQSDFYPIDGVEGPWWMEANGDVWREINQHMTVREGRGSFVTVALGGSSSHAVTTTILKAASANRPIFV